MALRIQISAAPKVRNTSALGFIPISRRVGGVFGPNGTFHPSPARSAGWLAWAWDSVLQGRFMRAAATGVGDDCFGHWHLSRMRRPYRTRGFQGIQTRHSVPGFDDPSRWDEEREKCIKTRATPWVVRVLQMMSPEGATLADEKRVVSSLKGW
jgi:hypothetical protein